MDIPTAVTLGKAAFDMAKGMVTMSKDAAVTEKAMELLQIILQLQERIRDAGLEVDALTRRARDLEDALRERDDLKRYRLIELPTKAQIFELDPVAAGQNEVSHCICPNCAADHRKSILQRHEYFFQCPRCQFTADFAPAPRMDWGESPFP